VSELGIKSLLIKSILRLLVCCVLFIQAGCDHLDPPVRYDCKASGEIFNYHDGLRTSRTGEQDFDLELKVFPLRHFVLVSNAKGIEAFEDRKIALDKSSSNEVELIYKFEKDDLQTHEKIISSVVINRTSGDLRLFHHRWIPPASWENSELYLLNGNCRK